MSRHLLPAPSHYIILFFFSAYRAHRVLHSFPTRRSSDLVHRVVPGRGDHDDTAEPELLDRLVERVPAEARLGRRVQREVRSEEHTSELQSLRHLVCRLLLEKKKKKNRPE